MSELRFSASQHHIPPVPLGHSTLINPAAAEKVMQEPLFGAFLHHFSPIPGKRPELEVLAGSRGHVRRASHLSEAPPLRSPRRIRAAFR